MKLLPDELKQILLDSHIMNEADFNVALKSAKTEDTHIQDYVVAQGFIKDSQLGQLIANHLKMPFISLSHVSIKDEVLHTIPEGFARSHNVIIFNKDKEGIHVATTEPSDLESDSLLKKKIKGQIIYHYATRSDIKETLSLYAQDATKAFELILHENIRMAKKKGKSSVKNSVELPIIKIVETIIEYAYKNKASDVHLEPEEAYSLLRFRVDGMLHDVVRLPITIHDQIITRIKVLSDLRTDEHQSPQDGKIRHKIYDENLNLRVSIVPITGGEKVVLRLLSEKTRKLSLKDLGFFDSALDRVEHAYKKPYGMVLTTGPTGSGKTTTLYSIVKLLNKRDVNVMTIEDPVEYEIEGVNQIQINSKSGLDFSSGLRSIVRQDPDVILVGEIRDSETAKIAVNSAMTGHLVLSTLHTNDAATAVPRLFDMGVEPFLVASSTNVIIGQRLVRRICEQCRVSFQFGNNELKILKDNFSPVIIKKHFPPKNNIRVYKGKGCEVCHDTGYIGRVGVYEVLEVDEEIEKLVIERKSADEITNLAIKKGMTTMVEDGLEKVKLGMTTIEEVIRVTKE